MKRIAAFIILMLSACSLPAQTTLESNYRYVSCDVGIVGPLTSGNSTTTVLYGIDYARIYGYGFGLKGGFDIFEEAADNAQMVGFPLKGIFRVNIPWYVGYAMTDHIFDTMIYQSDSFGEAIAWACVGCLIALLPKNIEFGLGVTPGFITAGASGIYERPASGLVMNHGLYCSFDGSVRLTGQIWRIGIFAESEFSYYPAERFRYEDAFETSSWFTKLRFGLNFKF